jgi:ADP-heptose:LPS heptosyltransferase
MSSKKILIVNFGGIGDILNTTAIACHHKTKDNSIEIDFLTKNKYEFLLKNNIYIDKVILSGAEFDSFGSEVVTRHFKEQMAFDQYSDVLFAAPYMSPLYDRTPRSTLLNIIYEETSGIKEWSCDFMPYVFLSKEEVQEADNFLQKTLGKYKIMIEYEYFSNQSIMDIECILSLCDKFNGKEYDIIFSGKNKPEYLDLIIEKYNSNIYHYDGSFLSNAHLYNNMNMFVGCSSGITCLTASNYCDHNIDRLELVRGSHWSTQFWRHLLNRKTFYKKQSFTNFFKKKYT